MRAIRYFLSSRIGSLAISLSHCWIERLKKSSSPVVNCLSGKITQNLVLGREIENTPFYFTAILLLLEHRAEEAQTGSNDAAAALLLLLIVLVFAKLSAPL